MKKVTMSIILLLVFLTQVYAQQSVSSKENAFWTKGTVYLTGGKVIRPQKLRFPFLWADSQIEKQSYVAIEGLYSKNDQESDIPIEIKFHLIEELEFMENDKILIKTFKSNKSVIIYKYSFKSYLNGLNSASKSSSKSEPLAIELLNEFTNEITKQNLSWEKIAKVHFGKTIDQFKICPSHPEVFPSKYIFCPYCGKKLNYKTLD